MLLYLLMSTLNIINCGLNIYHVSEFGQTSKTADATVDIKWCTRHHPLILDPFTFNMLSRMVNVQ